MSEAITDPQEELFPGKTDEQVAELARGFVLDEHCAESDGDDESPEPLGYET